jgi:hypothetical protein
MGGRAIGDPPHQENLSEDQAEVLIKTKEDRAQEAARRIYRRPTSRRSA